MLKWPPELKIEKKLLMISTRRPLTKFQNSFIEMFIDWLSTKIAKPDLLHWTKWSPELNQRKPLIGISYSTESITFMANLSSREQSRAIMALLYLFLDINMNIFLCISNARKANLIWKQLLSYVILIGEQLLLLCLLDYENLFKGTNLLYRSKFFPLRSRLFLRRDLLLLKVCPFTLSQDEIMLKPVLPGLLSATHLMSMNSNFVPHFHS